MDPRRETSIPTVINEALTDSEKLEKLGAGVEAAGVEQLNDVIERAKQLAQPVDDGIDRLSGSSENSRPANLQAPPRRIDQAESGNLTLDFFIYAPADEAWGRSITASWRLTQGDQSRLVWQEHVSDRSFMSGIAAYRSDAPKILGLIEESVSAYERAGRSS